MSEIAQPIARAEFHLARLRLDAVSVEQEGRRQRTHRSYPFEAGHFHHLAAFHADLAAMLEQGREALSLAETAGVPLAQSMSHIDIAAALYAETLDAGLETALA